MKLSASKRFEDLRVMTFIDGSNVLIEMGKFYGINLKAEKPTHYSIKHAWDLICSTCSELDKARGVRHHWFGEIKGTDETINKYKDTLNRRFVQPVLFKKGQGKEKRVDIALTTSLLVNALNKNFDIGVLVSGDKDYLSVVEEAKRAGVQVFGCFFENNINAELKREYDRFFTLGRNLQQGTFDAHKKNLESND